MHLAEVDLAERSSEVVERGEDGLDGLEQSFLLVAVAGVSLDALGAEDGLVVEINCMSSPPTGKDFERLLFNKKMLPDDFKHHQRG